MEHPIYSTFLFHFKAGAALVGIVGLIVDYPHTHARLTYALFSQSHQLQDAREKNRDSSLWLKMWKLFTANHDASNIRTFGEATHWFISFTIKMNEFPQRGARAFLFYLANGTHPLWHLRPHSGRPAKRGTRKKGRSCSKKSLQQIPAKPYTVKCLFDITSRFPFWWSRLDLVWNAPSSSVR